MRKFKLIARGLSSGLIVISLLLITQAPAQIVTHFNGQGTADSWQSRWWLLLVPIVVIALVEIVIGVSRWQRRVSGIGTVNFLTSFESKWIGGLIGIVIIVIGLMLQQIGWWR